MSSQAEFLLAKARKLVRTAQSLIKDGYPNDAGRGAYLAAYNAAQAYIADHTGRIAKTHSGTHTQFAQLSMLEPGIEPAMRKFLQEAYELKSSADYDVGEDGDVSLADATAAVEGAVRFVECIAELLKEPRAR